MSFLNKILPKKEEKEYFLILAFDDHSIKATISLITAGTLTIIGSGEADFSQDDEIIEAADIAISTAEKNIGEEATVKKAIFGVPSTFLENDKIKPHHLEQFKKITDTLSLSPHGVIEYSQALSYYLETKEESPPTLILLSIGKNKITYTHIRVGKIEKNIVVDRSDSITLDFEKTLSHSAAEILPSRIILYDEDGNIPLADLREELIKFPWHKHSTFLHTPKIETLEHDTLTTALAEAAGKSLFKEIHFEEKKIEEREKPKAKMETGEEENLFGFEKGKDIKEEKPKHHLTIQEEKDKEGSMMTEEKKSIFNKMPRLSINLPEISLNWLPVAAIIGILLLVSISFFALVWYYPKATVNLIVYPASSSSQIDVLFTASSDTSTKEKYVILAKSVSEEVTGEKTITASGKTPVGEKARGEVVIYNKTLNNKTFPRGTPLASLNLKFTLDDDLSIASASDTGEGLTFGKTTAKITAAEIGPEGNADKGSNFIFKDFPASSYYGKNNEKLSGGTSREVTSIAKADQDRLLSELTDELISTAKQQLNQKLISGDKLLEESIEKLVSAKKFSHEIGTEAQELSLSLTLKINTMVFNEKDLTELAKDSSSAVPSGYSIDRTRTQIRIREAKVDKKGDVLAKASLASFFFPEIDKEGLVKSIVGKPFNEASSHISTFPNIGGVEIVSENQLPFLKDKLPFKTQNINLVLVPR